MSGDGRLEFCGSGFAEAGHGLSGRRLHDRRGAGAGHRRRHRRRRRDRRRHGGGSHGQRRHRRRGRERAGRRQDAGGRCRQRRQLEEDAACALGRCRARRCAGPPTAAPGRCRAWRRRRRRAAACRRPRSAPGRRRRCLRAGSSAAPSRPPGESATAPPGAASSATAITGGAPNRRARSPRGGAARSIGTAWAGACGDETPKRSAQNTTRGGNERPDHECGQSRKHAAIMIDDPCLRGRRPVELHDAIDDEPPPPQPRLHPHRADGRARHHRRSGGADRAQHARPGRRCAGHRGAHRRQQPDAGAQALQARQPALSERRAGASGAGRQAHGRRDPGRTGGPISTSCRAIPGAIRTSSPTPG